MNLSRCSRAALVALVSLGMLIMGTAAPAAALPHYSGPNGSSKYERLLARLYQISFRTQFDEQSVGRVRDLHLDPGGELYLCAHAGGAVAPFTNAAQHMTCRVRPGQPLLLVGIATEWSSAEGFPTERAMRDRVNASLDEAAPGYPQVLLDGRPLPLTRVVTTLTRVDRIADPNLVGVVPPSRETSFVAGAFMIVVPAPRGVHTVEFRPVPGLSGSAQIDARCGR